MSGGPMHEIDTTGRPARRRAVVLALALPLVLVACGKRGPLRLPEKPAPATPAPAPDEDEAR